MNHPYKDKKEKSFWKKSVGDRHFADIADLWESMDLVKSDKIATAGSCFAQHIGNNLAARGAHFMDLEPAPPIFSSINEARQWGFGVFSCRYGNIYTTRQLIQLFDEAYCVRKPIEQIWEKDGRYFDALRPNIDPVGLDSPEAILKLRELHLAAVRKMFAELDVFVFTLGLTEGWIHSQDKTIYPIAPGVVAGNYTSEKYSFINLRHSEIKDDLLCFWEKLKIVNPKARMLLTVSPVPLAATATDNHVLVATTYSKSVLRSVAGEMAEDYEDIYYFPSYEIISAHPMKGVFFEPDLRGVNQYGVNLVMQHFFSGKIAAVFSELSSEKNEPEELICDEEKINEL